MYTMHLFFGLGSFLTPLITEQFHKKHFQKNQLMLHTNATIIAISEVRQQIFPKDYEQGKVDVLNGKKCEPSIGEVDPTTYSCLP